MSSTATLTAAAFFHSLYFFVIQIDITTLTNYAQKRSRRVEMMKIFSMQMGVIYRVIFLLFHYSKFLLLLMVQSNEPIQTV